MQKLDFEVTNAYGVTASFRTASAAAHWLWIWNEIRGSRLIRSVEKL